MIHSHEQIHQHNHHDHYSANNRAFALGIGLNIVFVVIEIVFGLAANSTALLADAGHNASDVLSLVFAWTAAWLANRKPVGKFTYGYRKTTILVSILNALLLFGAVAVIGWDAVGKFKHPESVAGDQVMIVAGIGIVINALTAMLFMKGQKEDLNIKGAFLHMAADAAVSLGVVISGFLINQTGLQWIDPVTSFVIIAVILWSTWNLFADSVDLAMDAVPGQIDQENVRAMLLSQNGVKEIHDLHIWAMSTTQIALTAHLVMPDGYNNQFIIGLQKELKNKFGIGHTTFQIEKEKIEKGCNTNCEAVV